MRRAALLAWWSLLPVLPGIAASRAVAQAPAEPGASLTIYVMTMGQGDAIWEKFGHNAIGVRDAAAGTDIVYNWGTFSFDQPGFVMRFLRADTRYWLQRADADATVAFYASINRSVWIQELDLTPAERAEVQRFVEWNAREENKFYRYDYFLDNCSTRVRDVIDRALQGALQRDLASIPANGTYRFHALRLTRDAFAASFGMDLALGLPADRPITAWDEGFIPMLLRDRLGQVKRRDASAGGAERPLVRAERQLFAATRTAEADHPPQRAAMAFLIGALGATILVLLARRAGGGLAWARALSLGLSSAWAGLAGLVGVALTFAWTGTRHLFMYRNLNLLQFDPLWLLLVLVLPLAVRRQRRDPAARHTLLRALAISAGVVSAVGFVAFALPALRQETGAAMALATPLDLAVAWSVAHLFPGRRRT